MKEFLLKVYKTGATIWFWIFVATFILAHKSYVKVFRQILTKYNNDLPMTVLAIGLYIPYVILLWPVHTVRIVYRVFIKKEDEFTL